MKKFLTIIPVFLALVLALGAGWFFLVGKHMKVKDFELALHPDSQSDWLFEDIKKDLLPKLKKFENENLFKFSFEELSQDIQRDPRVKQVLLRREFPTKIKIQILPHEPVLGWVDERGFVHPVARDNKILPGLKSDRFLDFALLRGKEFKSNKDLRQKALDLMMEIPDEGVFRKSLISEIRYRKASGGFEVFLSDPSVLVRLGENDFKEKSARVQKVLSYLQSREINGRVIDSRYQKKVVVRLRNEP